MRLASLSIAAAMAVLPLHAAAAQHPGPLVDVESEDAPGGVRIELLGGYDDDGFEHGLLYGTRIGYDFNLSRRFLLGIEGELSDVTTDQELTLPPTSLTVRDGPDVYAGARATIAVSDRFRLHGAAGYTRARHGSFFLAPGGIIGGQEISHDGFRLSAGAQFLIGRHAFIGAEYRYSDYEQFVRRNQYVATLGFRF